MSNSTGGISNATQASTQSFVTALYINGGVFALEIAVFAVLQTQLPLIYSPRSKLPQESKRAEPFARSILKWPLEIFLADYSKVKRANGMDAYYFLRFLRMLIRMFIPIWLVSWAVLLPIDSVNTVVGNASGLDLFVFGNISPDKQRRYSAHIILVYFFTAWICYNIRYEMSHYVASRQHYLTSEEHSKKAQSRTLLITGIPSRYITERQLFSVFSYLPGGVHKVWLNRDLKDLPDVYKRREHAFKKLEAAETTLLATAATIHGEQRTAATKLAQQQAGKTAPSGTPKGALDESQRRLTDASSRADGELDLEGQLPLSRADKLVPRDRRPTHRLPTTGWLPSLPFTGKTVDSIDWARAELMECNAALAAGREQWRADVATDEDSTSDVYQPLNSAFVLFNQQIAAHLALQAVTHHAPYRMAGKYIEVSQHDVIWSNLSMNPYEQRFRLAVSYVITVGIVIVWSIPVAFIGALSSVTTLCSKAHWLEWVCRTPDQVQHIITSVVPPLLLVLLTLLLPIVLRLLARFEGVPSRSGLELSLMNRFFGFQVIHSFLVVTLSSGLIKALPSLLSNPASVPALLAQKLPLSSNFFLTYILLQGLSGTAGGFLQVVTLILYYIRSAFTGITPRSVFNTKYGPRTITMGTLFPTVTLLMVIAIAYSIISPIINGLACATFFLFYMLYKYLFLWCMQQPTSQDTGGLFFPKAIHHVFIGLYIEQVCLCALFFLARDVKQNASAIPEAILTLLLILFTIFFHLTIIDSYWPLVKALPLTLADKTYGVRRDDVVAEGGVPSSPTAEKLQHEAGVRATSPVPDPAADASGVERLPLQQRRTGSGAPSALGSGTPRPMGSRQLSARWDADDDAHTASSVRAEPAPMPADDDGPTDFTHPAVANHPRTIWLPRDTLGLAQEEEAALRAAGIAVSTVGARMDEHGHVDIDTDGQPPDLLD